MRRPERSPSLQPLRGITVVSLEQAIAAPYATRQLADLGARVIKVERPGPGDFARAYEKVDVLLSPTTPTTAFNLGEKVDDPLAMYNFDLCTLPLNLAGLCGMSIPVGLANDTNLPVGLQIMAPAHADDRLYRVGAAYEATATN